MVAPRLKDFLDSHHVKYVVCQHSPAFTAQEVAASAHVKGKDFAKTVVLKIEGKLALAVLPASQRVAFDALRETVGTDKVELATEAEFKAAFPGCELGAMPPFGNLFGMETYVSARLAKDEEIAFNAGTHTEVLRMKYADFERLVTPKVTSITWPQ
ncbi:MAG TPA: YbaK/EbsC family protein [Candidatus Polarisedimenticolaceae bacterium]